MIAWLKRILGITALEVRAKEHREETWRILADLRVHNSELGAELDQHRAFVDRSMAELKEYTRVDADMGIRGNNTIVLTGVYRNKAYVQFFDMGDGEFKALVDQLQSMRKHALIRHVDAPHAFHGLFKMVGRG